MIGACRHYVRIDEWVETSKNDRGTSIGDWYPLAENVPAEIITLTGTELEVARKLVASATHQIKIRYRPCVNTRLRVIWNNKTYEVNHINNVEQRNRWLVLTTSTEDTCSC